MRRIQRMYNEFCIPNLGRAHHQTTNYKLSKYHFTIVASLLHSLVERNKQKQTMQLSLCCASIDPAIQYRNKELVGWHIGESCGQTEENRRRVLDALHRLNMDGAE